MANWTEEDLQNLLKKSPGLAGKSSSVPKAKKSAKVEEFIPKEHYEQCLVISWARLNEAEFPALKWLYAVPNGQAKFSPALQAYYKAEGLKSGVSDLCLPHARGSFHGFYLELKRVKGGKVSDNQKAFIDFVKAENYFVEVANGHEEGIKFLKHYLALPKRIEQAIELAEQLF